MSDRAVDRTPLDVGDPHGRGAAERPDKSTERRLWFSILAAPAAWTVAEVVAFAASGRKCGVHGTSGALGPLEWALVIGVPLAAALVAGAGLLVAIRVFRSWTGPVPITRAEGWNRVEFMAIAGAIISLLLLLNIVYFAVLPLIVDPCLRVT